MIILAQVVGLALWDRGALGARPAWVVHDFAGFTWHVRARTPAFQRLLSGTVELSTEALAVVALWGLVWGWSGTSVARGALPAWAAIQLVVIGLAMAWDVGGRCRVPHLRATAHSMRIGSRLRVPMASVRAVEASGHGWGPVHRAELAVAYVAADGTAREVVVAADGDDVRSLQGVAARILALAPHASSTRRAVGVTA